MSNIETINPATGKILATYENSKPEEVSRKVKNAREAFVKWKKLDSCRACRVYAQTWTSDEKKQGRICKIGHRRDG